LIAELDLLPLFAWQAKMQSFAWQAKMQSRFLARRVRATGSVEARRNCYRVPPMQKGASFNLGKNRSKRRSRNVMDNRFN
jgi:hypothetical protein